MRQSQLRWEQIDPRVAQRVGTCLQQKIMQTSVTPSATRHTHNAAPPESALRRWAFSAFVAALFVGLYLSVFFNFGEATTTMFALLPVGLLVSSTAPVNVRRREEGIRRREEAARRLRGPIHADNDLRSAFDHAAVSRAERLYGEIVLSLAAEPETSDRRLRREILRECNLLLRDYFLLRGRRERAARLAPAEPSVAMTTHTERETLQARRDAALDPTARDSWQESLSLLEERTDSLRSLRVSVARLEAHEEVICQALALARAAIARASVSSDNLRAPEIARLRRAVRRLTARAAAEEELE